MSTAATAKKRKSADGTTVMSKKVKITKSADKPAPLKSALKKSKSSALTQPAAAATRKTTKKPIPAPIDDEEDTPELTADQTAALLAGFSSDSDSEASTEGKDGVALSALPKAPVPNKTQSSADAAADATDPETTPAVLYIGRIPHGFYEPQMRAYFSQFGHITQLRLARNKKTGRSQHYAFVEFASAAVAEIVRRTMDKYLLFGRLLQVRVVPKELVRENMFAGAGRRARRKAPRNRMEGKWLERGVGREEWEGRVERERRRRVEMAEKLAALGYEFEMPEVRGVEDVAIKANGAEGGDVEVEVLTEDVQSAGDVVSVLEEVTKKRPAHGKKETKKKVKKVKT